MAEKIEEIPQASKALKIFMYSVDGAGHINSCIGLAQALQSRGHQVSFLISAQSSGNLKKKWGFNEVPLQSSASALPESPASKGDNTKDDADKKQQLQMLVDILMGSGLISSKSSLEKAKSVHLSSFDSLYRETLEFDPQIAQAIEREQPDAIIVDHFFIPPAIQQSKRAMWMLLWSGNPLSLYGSDQLPPFSSGYSTTSDRTKWQEFDQIQRENIIKKVKENQRLLDEACDYTPPPRDIEPYFNRTSPYLNIYGFPGELDYDNLITIPDSFIRVDAFCRHAPEPFELPEKFCEKNEKLIYFSLGSMGGVDVTLMKRILSVFARTPHKYIVSKGPLHESFSLPDNCWGDEYLPQTQILPMVDLVITHGGNNTVTETFCNGVPMIVMPLFGDQYDNGQRVDETGFGARIEPYNFEEQELIDTIERLLGDDELKQRLKQAQERITTSNSKAKACHRIELEVAKFQQQ